METQPVDRTEVYKKIAHLLLTRKYEPQEFELFRDAIGYLSQEIKNHEPTEAANNPGSQG